MEPHQLRHQKHRQTDTQRTTTKSDPEEEEVGPPEFNHNRRSSPFPKLDLMRTVSSLILFLEEIFVGYFLIDFWRDFGVRSERNQGRKEKNWRRRRAWESDLKVFDER